MSKYEVEVKSMEGTLDNKTFEKMAKKGDITATKIAEIMEKEVTITGYSECEIETQDKKFNILYVNTKEFGIVSAGSEIFKESVEDYFGEVERFKIKSIKTKKGNTYKAVPILSYRAEENKTEPEENKTEPEEKKPEDELPF